MQADTNLDLDVRHVPHLEGSNTVENVQGHVGHLSCVASTVPVWNSRGYHVRISDGLHLKYTQSINIIYQYNSIIIIIVEIGPDSR